MPSNTLNLSRVDLNLIRVFCVIYDAKSVSGAAQQLHLSQPAISHALTRLRELLRDPLFVRTRAGMIPTLVADRAYDSLRLAVDLVRKTVQDSVAFDPASSTRRFRFAISDIGELVFLPPIMERIDREAPNVRLEAAEIAVPEIPGEMAAGRIDLAIGNLPGLGQATRFVHLFEERYACLVRKDHPQIGARPTLNTILNARHIRVSSQSQRSAHAILEEALLREGINLKIALQVPHFTVVPSIVKQTDLVATIPLRVARVYARDDALRVVPFPVQLPRINVTLHWLPRQEDDQANRWLREMMTRLLSKL